MLGVPHIQLNDGVFFAENRCRSLREKGLLTSDTTEGQGTESLDGMHAYVWDPETDVGHAFGYFVAPDARATKYANDHGRFDMHPPLAATATR